MRADGARWFADRASEGGTRPVLLRHRPSVVEAMQVHVGHEAAVAEWSGGVAVYGRGVVVWTDTGDLAHADYGDWVIRGPRGNFYPAPDGVIFSEYEAVIP